MVRRLSETLSRNIMILQWKGEIEEPSCLARHNNGMLRIHWLYIPYVMWINAMQSLCGYNCSFTEMERFHAQIHINTSIKLVCMYVCIFMFRILPSATEEIRIWYIWIAFYNIYIDSRFFLYIFLGVDLIVNYDKWLIKSRPQHIRYGWEQKRRQQKKNRWEFF